MLITKSRNDVWTRHRSPLHDRKNLLLLVATMYNKVFLQSFLGFENEVLMARNFAAVSHCMVPSHVI